MKTPVYKPSFGPEVISAWKEWAEQARNRCHIDFKMEGNNFEDHYSICFQSGLAEVRRVAADIPGLKPARILELGSSVGFKCHAFKKNFKESLVIGVEPDLEAVRVGSAVSRDTGLTRINFIQGVGEELPFQDGTFDLVVAHTVIEHVKDVSLCIREMGRVLKPGGVLHFEAPNYLWPVEPHLQILTLPLCPKPIMRFLARLQGAGDRAWYVSHLQLVSPGQIEKLFRLNNLVFEDRMKTKIFLVSRGKIDHIVAYKRLAWVLRVLDRLGLSRIVGKVVFRSGFYPSLLYTVRHSPGGPK